MIAKLSQKAEGPHKSKTKKPNKRWDKLSLLELKLFPT